MTTRHGAAPSLSTRGALAGFALIAIVAVALAATPILEPVDRAILAQQFSALRALWPRDVAKDVVIVGIDDESVKRMPEPISLWHRHFGRFLRATAAGGAAAVGLDVVFPDRSYDALVPGYDKELLLGILAARRAAPLILARTIDPEGQERTVHPLLVAAAGQDAMAYALLPIDNDGVVRRFDEHLGAGGETVRTLAGELARRLGAPTPSGIIDYSRGAPFDYVRFHEVLAWFDAGDTAALQKIFAGKPVLLGGVFKFEDQLGAPVNLAAWEPALSTVPGVVVHAQAARNLLNGGFIEPVPHTVTIVVALLAALAWWFATTLRRASIVIVAGTIVIAAAGTALLARGWHLPPSPVLAALVLAAGARAALEGAAGIRDRLKLRRAFSGYVSPGVMDDIMGGQIAAELGGASHFVCALFSDIRGYTTRSEGMTPQQIVSFLNAYFERVVEVIHARGGTVVTFMGDGIMAIFGAPKTLPNPCAAAYEAAQDIIEYMREFNARGLAEGEAPIDIGVGLHAGEAVIGHVGSSTRHDYTAIGDVINVASRLEGVTKEVGYRLVYSGIVAEALPAGTPHAELGFQQIKGHTPVEAYGYDKVG